MKQLTVPMNEWFFTQALIGYKRILEDYGETVRMSHYGIVVEKRHLEIFADAFFSYYLKRYSVAAREERTLRRMHRQFKEGDRSVKKELNDRINKTKNNVNKYFSEMREALELIEAADSYRKEKVYTAEMDDWLDVFISRLYTKEIDEKLTVNLFKNVYLTPYFGQVSMLNVSHARKSIEEQKKILHADLVEPALLEWSLWQAINEGNEEKVFDVLDASSSGHLNHLKRVFKKMTTEQMIEYVERELHRCTFTGFPIAVHSFEESVFSPLALSLKSVNVTWNVKEQLLPLSSLAKLLLFCSQAGATISQGRSVFVFYSGSFDQIYRTNQFYAGMKDPNKTFDEIVFDLVREQKLRADYLNNHYMIYEYESDYRAKKTLLDYMVMTPPVIKLFADHGKLFEGLHYSYKSVLIRLLIKGYDSKNLILHALRENIKQGFSTFEVIRMVQIRHLNQLLVKEGLEVDTNQHKRYVWALVKSAAELQRHLSEKKAQSIAYRLLNAIRSNNKDIFMDTVMRTYISCDLPMPGLLLEALHEDKLDFATVGNAWVAGLVSKPSDIGTKGEQTDE